MMTAIQDDKPMSSKRQRRKIRFHERVQFKTIRHVSEFSDDEINDGWYDKDDFNRMSENVSDIAKLISEGQTTLDGEELCTRGLEHIVEEELADYRAEKMINSIDAVLDEQEEQWDEGKEEPGLIAELYAEYAKPLLREAHLIGLKDAEEGYKTWDDLLNEEEYQKLTVKRTDLDGNGDIEKLEKSKKKKVQASKHSANEDMLKTKMKKNRVKKSDKTTKQFVPRSPTYSNNVIKTGSEKKKKKKVKSKDKASSSPQSYTDDSFSSSSLQSSASSQMSFVNKQNSISSINSYSLRDTSMNSTSDEFDTIPETEKISPAKGKGFSSALTKNNTTLLKQKNTVPLQNGVSKPAKNNKPITQKAGKRMHLRRSASDRKYGKYGSEMSPFTFRRDGSLTFRRPDVEKLKREEKEKRKSCVLDSLTTFSYGDEDEDDILAGILSGR